MDRQTVTGQNKRRERNLTSLKELFSDFASDSISGTSFKSVLHLRKNWASLMGDKIAQISLPYRIHRSVLHVAVLDSFWLTELSHLKNDMAAKIAETGVTIGDIRFNQAKVRPKARKESKPPAELTPEQNAFVDNTSGTIKSAAVRDSYRKAIVAYFRKGL